MFAGFWPNTEFLQICRKNFGNSFGLSILNSVKQINEKKEKQKKF